MVKQGTDKYVPRRDRPWYGRLEDMSHQVQDGENERHDKATKGKGYLMEKYREQHERDFMQGHDCGKGDCPDHEKKPLGWDFVGESKPEEATGTEAGQEPEADAEQ